MYDIPRRPKQSLLIIFNWRFTFVAHAWQSSFHTNKFELIEFHSAPRVTHKLCIIRCQLLMIRRQLANVVKFMRFTAARLEPWLLQILALPARKARSLKCSSEAQLIIHVNDLEEEPACWGRGLLEKPAPNQEVCPKKHKTYPQKSKSGRAATAVTHVNFMRSTGLPTLTHYRP